MTTRSMFDGGLGLPVAAIGWSVVISFAGCWAWLESAHFWAFLADAMRTGHLKTELLAEGYVGYFIAAAFALLAQWTANFVILRIRQGQSRLLWGSYAICALYAAVSLHHVHEAMAAPAWRAEVAERAALRAPDLAIIATNDEFIAQARARFMTLSADQRASRNESVTGPLTEAMAQAAAASDAARARLQEMPALAEKRPVDVVDFIVGVIAAALAVLEFTLYWGMGGTPKLTGARNTTENIGPGTTAETALPGSGDVVDLRPGAPQQTIPENVKVGTLSFAKGLQGRALLDELDKAGLIDKAACWSKVNAYPRPERRKAAA